MGKLTAYELLGSLDKYQRYLESDPIFSNCTCASVHEIAIKYAVLYFKEEFFNRDGVFQPKEKKLMNEEYRLFRYHPAFIEDFHNCLNNTFMGYKLTK